MVPRLSTGVSIGLDRPEDGDDKPHVCRPTTLGYTLWNSQALAIMATEGSS